MTVLRMTPLPPAPLCRGANRPSWQEGFTLIELMIVIAVIGILAAVAYPSFVQILIRSDRTDGRNALLDLQLAQEKYRSNNSTFASALTNLQTSLPVVGGNYYSQRQLYQVQIDASTVNRAGYLVSATAVAGKKQNNDKVAACRKLALTVTLTGTRKGHLDPNTGNFVESAECW